MTGRLALLALLSRCTGRAMDRIEIETGPDWVRFILERPMREAPGTSFAYSGAVPHLLSAIVSRASDAMRSLTPGSICSGGSASPT